MNHTHNEKIDIGNLVVFKEKFVEFAKDWDRHNLWMGIVLETAPTQVLVFWGDKKVWIHDIYDLKTISNIVQV